MAVCPFCNQNESRVILTNTHALAIPDGFPVSPGHTLIIPRRHIASFFEASREEQTALLDLLAEVRESLLNPPQPPFAKGGSLSLPDGFNIGINDGAAAGQTVMHLHLHLIPRYAGDMPDPRGGVRWIFPDKAPYWDK
jgi:diadenosine tetraphosphate (Ap4A) HIT family hydrolase